MNIFTDELIELMKKHNIKEITPENKDAIILIKDDLSGYITGFKIISNKNMKG